MTKITSNPKILADKELNFVDMHHHSTYSDGNQTPSRLAKYFIKHNKGLAITDHNRIQGAVQLAKQKKLFSIPGIEVTSKQLKDLLVYFYSIKDLIAFWNKEIKKNFQPKNHIFNFDRTNIDLFELIDKIKDYNGVSILAHPFSIKPKHSYKLLLNKNFRRKIDGVESHNFTVGKYKKTLLFVRPFRKPLIAGSDSHDCSYLNTLTGTHGFSRASFLDNIIKNKNIIYYEKGNFWRRISEQLTVIKNNITFLQNKK